MTSILAENIAPLMFVSLVVVLLLGYPVAFSLGAIGIGFGALGIHLGILGPELAGAIPQRIWGVMSNDTLLAIPFFTFMGLILERSGMAEDLLDTIAQLFGSIRGGLAYAVILVGALLGATTGVVAASVISMGLISLPIMLRYGYNRSFASGVIAASGTLAQIVPPSLVLIVLADQLGRSVGDMYAGAFLPASILIGAYLLFAGVVALTRPAWAPAVPPEHLKLRDNSGGRGMASLFTLVLISVAAAGLTGPLLLGEEAKLDQRIVVLSTLAAGFAFLAAAVNRLLRLNLLSQLTEQVTFVLIPPLILIFLVLGTIFLGVATPTEGGAMGATGALLMAISRKRLSWSLLHQAINSTGRLSTFVIFILIGARIFSLTFYAVDGHVWVQEHLLSLPGEQLGFLIVVNVLIFFLAFFLDFFELAFIVIPLIAPVAESLGIDLVWFGVIIAVNLQTSFLHPPFGFSLFFLRSVAPAIDYIDKITGKTIRKVTIEQIYWGAIPFIVIQLITIGVLVIFPDLVLVYKDTADAVDPASVIIELPDSGLPQSPLEPDLK